MFSSIQLEKIDTTGANKQVVYSILRTFLTVYNTTVQFSTMFIAKCDID